MPSQAVPEVTFPVLANAKERIGCAFCAHAEQNTWDVFLVHVYDGSSVLVESDVSREQALVFFRSWPPCRKGNTVVLWPHVASPALAPEPKKRSTRKPQSRRKAR
jgi:hypothetical protein